jgi:hypothetical protein
MVEKVITSPRNVVDFGRYRESRASGSVSAISVRACRHCGAALLEGESDDDCSSAFNIGMPRRFYAD